MGMQDRDYYREIWKKRLGHVERTPFRLPASRVDDGEDDGGAYLRLAARKKTSLHPVLSFLRFAVICLFTFLILRFFKR